MNKLLKGFVLGSAVGLTIGLLMAPEEGRRLRKRILNEAEEMADNILKDSLSTIKE